VVCPSASVELAAWLSAVHYLTDVRPPTRM
jgi:hypothetical protein